MCTRCPVLVGVFVCAISTVFAEIPQVISYQGKVTDGSGTPVADGSYTMRFQVYDAVSAGTLKWDSGDQTVTVSGGVFSALLGESPHPALSLEFDADYWVETTIEGDVQSPRVRLGSVGYAYMASGLVAGTEVIGSVTTGTSAALKGTNTATSGVSYGVYGQSASTYGMGVCGRASASTGTVYGVYGETPSTAGVGVYGRASAMTGATHAVYGRNDSTEGVGLYGWAAASEGAAYGVRGRSDSTAGRGVYGVASATTGSVYGVYGETPSTSGMGVFGRASASTGSVYGVYGETPSTSGRGVRGEATAASGTTYGVYGASASTVGRGVYGRASSASGVNYGVYGSTVSTAGYGVYGSASATSGSAHGGFFESWSTSGYGVIGDAPRISGTTYGVYGHVSSTDGYGVYSAGNLAASGSKSCVVKTSKGPTLLYCQESPECWFEDFGSARLANGQARVDLDPGFLETVTVDEANPMHVFVQPQDPRCKGLAVMPGSAGFEVVELLEGASDGAFSYRVVAKRKGFEGKRLDYCAAAERDSYLYPELREKELWEREERARMEDPAVGDRQ